MWLKTNNQNAEIWKKNSEEITKVFAFDKEVRLIELDPFMETSNFL